MARYSREFIKRLRLRHRGYIILLVTQITYILLLPAAKGQPELQSLLNIGLAGVLLSQVVRYTQIKRYNSFFVCLGLASMAMELTWRLSLELNPAIGHWLTPLHLSSWLLFYFIAVIRAIKSLIREPFVTVPVVMAAVDCYLLIGVAGGILLTGVLELHPTAFNAEMLTNGDTYLANITNKVSHFSPLVMAASFNILTTLGSGIMKSGNTVAQVVSTFITISGQLYVAILIALILGRPRAKN